MKAVGKKRIRQMTGVMAAVLLLLSAVVFPYASSSQSDTVLPGANPVEEALSETVVNCMLQDSSGFLWFGTQTGLYKYNGYSLEPYTFSTAFSNKFASNFITSICEDNSKNIWIGTFGGGVFKLDTQTGDYSAFNDDPQNPGDLGDNFIRALYPDASGRLWIGTQNRGLGVLDPASGAFRRFENTADNEAIGLNTVSAIRMDKAGALWIGTAGEGLSKLDPQSGKLLRFEDRGADPGGPVYDVVSALYIDRADTLWIVTGDGRLSRLDTASGRRIGGDFEELSGLRVNAVCEDNSGALWIGTYGGGVRMLDKDSGKFTVNGLSLAQNTLSSHYRVISLYADTSGNLWIGTEGSGIARINTNLNFASYKSDISPDIRFSDDVVLSIYKDRSGIIWIGTANGGVNRFDRENRRIDYYKNDPRDSGSISGNAICSIYEDSLGNLWFGTVDGVLNRLEPASGMFTHYRINSVENTSVKDNGILSMYEDRDGFLWACAANGGLVRLDKGTGLLTQFTNDPQGSDSISSNHVLSIAGDDAGGLWVGTAEGGLNRLDTATNKFTRYSVDDLNSNTQTLAYSVNAIVNDDDVLWLATDRGLYKFHKSSGKLIPVTDNRQIADTSVFGLLKGGGDNLWLSTLSGLIKYKIQTGDFKKYDFDGGLQRNQYIAGAYHQSADGEMFFGGTNGFSCFYDDKIKDNTHKPPVVITDFKIFDASTGPAGTDEISLTYKDNFISFEFAALDYANPAKNQYAYKLEGFDADWHYSGTRNYANYTNLDGGEYVLRIKASNNDGLWNEQGTQIRLVIAPPFWRTPWFAVAASVFSLAAVILLVKIRTRSIRLKSVELERQVAERTKALDQANEELRHIDELKSGFLSTVSHEIRTPLSVMLGFTELIADKIEKAILPNIDLNDQKIRKATENIGRDLNIITAEGDRLSALIDNLLNISKIESGKMDWRNEALAVPELIEQALSVTRPIIEKAELAVHVNIEAGLPEISGDRDMLTQVLINLISNAVKFTREGHIRLCAENSDGRILISVEDTGAGIKEADLDKIFERFYKAGNPMGQERNTGMGLGLYICRQIIEKHGGKIWAESRPGKGSTFHFTVLHLQDNHSLISK